LTGGIGSGKSTVAAMLRELGAIVIDSDLLARQVVAPGTPGLAQVVAAFGPDVLAADGSMDRAKVGAIVFADPAQRQRLEAIVWPLVAQESAALAATAGPDDLVVHDIPLLVETGQQSGFDAVLVVDVPVRTQVERLVRDRGMAEEEARARIAAQATREQRLAVASHVIDNTGTIEDLRRRVAEVLDELRA
jgi:dephospho-CoA kinase